MVARYSDTSYRGFGFTDSNENDSSNLNSRLIGIIIILALGIISYFGSSIIAGLDNLTSVVKIVLVLVFIFTCLWLVRGLNFSSPNVLTASSANLGGFKGFLSAYGTVFFFFTGFSFLPVNAEKMKIQQKFTKNDVPCHVNLFGCLYDYSNHYHWGNGARTD